MVTRLFFFIYLFFLNTVSVYLFICITALFVCELYTRKCLMDLFCQTRSRIIFRGLFWILSFFLIPERTVKTLHREQRTDVWQICFPFRTIWLSTCTLYVCDNCTQVSMLQSCFFLCSVGALQHPQIFLLNTKYNVMFIPYLLYKKTTTTTRWCTFCLRYCTRERFVSNGWFPSSLNQCRHTNTNLALWWKKRDRLPTDRI